MRRREMDNLVKGLRGELLDCNCAAYSDSECCCDTVWPEQLCKQAADEIESLRQRCAELEKERDELIGRPIPLTEWQKMENELAACQADAARYRYLRHASRRECLDRSGPEAGCWIDCEDENHMLILLTEEDADNAIDAAMAKVDG